MTEYTPAQKKALDMEKSVCVTAGAGTGKTFLLTKRYLELLKGGNSPKDIVALTYTEKAAAEMQTKISSALKKESDDNPHLKECFENFSQATINTFHGFCFSILKEFAYEAGVDPGFSVMEELDKNELVSNTIRDVLENPPEDLFDSLVYLHLHLSPQTLSKIISTLISSKPEVLEWFGKFKNSPEDVRKEWVGAYKNILVSDGVPRENVFFQAIDSMTETEYLPVLKDWFYSNRENINLINRLKVADDSTLEDKNGKKNGNGNYLVVSDNLLRAKTPEDIRRVCANAKKLVVKENKKRMFTVSQEEKETAAMFLTIFQSLSLLPGKDSEVFSHTKSILLDLYEVATHCKIRISREKERADVMDFDDILAKADELLSDAHPEILKAVSSRYHYILVDEVQDNDPMLVDFVLKLCGNPKENDRLFIVGDAKQSIYLFRNADVVSFMDFLKVFPDEPVALDTSFRSTPEIINFVNSLFSEIFRVRANDWDPDYNPILPHRKDQHGGVEMILLPKETSKDETNKKEAEILASWIYDAVINRELPVYENGKQRPAKFSDVAILLEKRTALSALLKALEKYQIPYTEVKGKDFYGRQETKDVWAVLSAVLYPEEDIPLYGALRSPYFAVSDAELCRASSDKRGTLISRLQTFAKENPESRTAHALGLLSRWQNAAQHLSPAECLSQIISESEILSVYAGIPGGDRMEGNLLKLLDILRTRSSSKPFSLYEFVELLETSMDEMLKEGEGEPLSDCGNRVKIITVHSSKGLEYPIVCVAFAGAARDDKMPPLVTDDTLGAGVSVRLSWMPIGNNKTSPARYNVVRSAIQPMYEAKDAAEHKRLFYVALTRAKDYLVVCGSAGKKDGSYSAKSFLGLYDQAKDALSEKPKYFNTIVCELPESVEHEIFVPEGDIFFLDGDEEEKVSISKDAAYAMQRGTLLHEVFAGAKPAGAEAAYFAQLYSEFLASELMQNVVREWCEMPIFCGGERRVIDRFVEYGDGRFAVIDYKSGSLAEAKKSGRFEKYQRQVLEYVSLMKEIVGGEVSGWLYFAEEDRERIIRV